MTVDKIKKEMSISVNDTIFALASGAGRAGVSILRVSGAGAKQALITLNGLSLPKARTASVRKLYNIHGELLDDALVLWFLGPASFTGEDMVELHVHGSAATVEIVSKALFALGLRQAMPGEFTRRAFSNGKMDLTEAEGLADLIDADTEGQRKQALQQMQGGLKTRYEDWRSLIIDALANVEGEIDFPDEGDIPNALALRAGPILEKTAVKLQRSLSDSSRGESIRHGIEIVIIGAPNAGKSSLINALARREAAIVSSEAGTTRDIIEVHMQIAGLPVRISDTAGLRDTGNAVEAEGVRRALVRAGEADLRMAIIDSNGPENTDVINELKPGDFIIYNKIDMRKPANPASESLFKTFFVSVKTGEGLGALEASLSEVILTRFNAGEQAGLTRARHVNCVTTALSFIKKAQKSLLIAPELAGADLHEALHAIKELAGETDIEAVLDRVFSSFCIGK